MKEKQWLYMSLNIIASSINFDKFKNTFLLELDIKLINLDTCVHEI